MGTARFVGKVTIGTLTATATLAAALYFGGGPIKQRMAERDFKARTGCTAHSAIWRMSEQEASSVIEYEGVDCTIVRLTDPGNTGLRELLDGVR